MATSTAKYNYLRIAPRKVRMVADLVRGKNVREARTILQYTVKGGTEPVLKVLNSAVDAAKKNKEADEATLFISKITIDQGPTLKRWRARARGRAYPIHKKTSHIILELDQGDVKTVKVAEQKVQSVEAPAEEKTKKTNPRKRKNPPNKPSPHFQVYYSSKNLR